MHSLLFKSHSIGNKKLLAEIKNAGHKQSLGAKSSEYSSGSTKCQKCLWVKVEDV